jgi:DNA mismatch repair protein MutH
MEVSLEYDRCDAASIERYAKRLIDKTLIEVLGPDITKAIADVRNDRRRGSFGNILEDYYFKIRPDNRSGLPDFDKAGVELKSTPMRRRGTKFVAKERMVLSMINYMDLVNETWEGSSFLVKNRHLLTVLYVHEDGKAVIEYRIKIVGLWDFPEDDLKIIRKDWLDIQTKVKEGRAEKISERDTNYLGACTKGQNAITNWRCQPHSNVKAKGRAFSLKASYVNSMIEKMTGRGDANPLENKVIKDPDELRERTLEDLVVERFEPFIGKDIDQISLELGIAAKKNAKNFNDIITKTILKVKDRMIEFEKADIVVKSIVLETSGRLKESVSFPAFDYIELDKERDWGSTKIRTMFDRKFFFVIYQKRPDDKKVLRRVMFWTIPSKDLLEVKKVWQSARKCIHEGNYEDLPRISDNPVSHVRPHGRNALDVVPTPDGGMTMKRCFWLNARYIAEQVGGQKWSDYSQSKPEYYGKGAFVQRAIDRYEEN